MIKKVVISGAGIGGLTAALCLLEKGFEIQVLEQAPELKAVGAGLQLSANATRVLCNLGLQSVLETVTIKPGGKCIRLWNTGQEWKLFDLGSESIERYGYPYMMLYRPDLHNILVDALNERCPGALKLGAKTDQISQDDQGVQVRTESGEVFTGDVLIGADGVHSVTRAQWVAEDKPEFSGCIAWRGVLPIEKLPASMQGPSGVNWVGPGAHVIHYPVNGGRLVSFTGIVEKDSWTTESWTEQGSIEECLQDFNGWHEDVQTLVQQLEAPLRWAMMVREPLDNWTNGRITLLGDAAHPTLPFLAQGAGMAIEDGCVIARAIETHAADPEHALRVYQATRIERTTRIVHDSKANMHRFHNPKLASAAGAAEYVANAWEQSTTRDLYGWLFSYAPETEPLAII